jgi:hypothetical protein
LKASNTVFQIISSLWVNRCTTTSFGDSAYVVVPATMTFKVGGKQVTQSGAVFTVALRKIAEGWRIGAWAWTKGTNR